jgi:CheY-like chemotaxis protein
VTKRETATVDNNRQQNSVGAGPFSAKVLIADDEPGNLKLTEIQLCRLGLDVVSVNNGQQAIDLALSQSFDVIFMDMQMPIVDGFTATSLIREKGGDTPIIALTAYAFSEDRQRCLDAGCDDYISKPVDPHILHEIVKKYCPQPARSS